MKTSMFAVLLVSCAALAQAPPASPFIGKWRLNLAKSTYSPGPKPGPAATQAYQWVVRPDGLIVGTNIGINGDGVPGFNLSVARHDGKDYPTYGNATLAEFMATGKKTLSTLAFKPVDARRVEIISKNDGKRANQTRFRTLSEDGKTMTDTTKGTNAQGQAFNNVLVFDPVP